ncbi:hypothetical protein NDU88_007103 [Pleurodeles waltl]|uniref:Uncharacterized protein n=1 Tax=Pleurodeles waltl TaxID=8319 RepID=A0AAV7U0I3_PLEWA|nr:hypothetical protein NDU88_007103 [Pleurodeles waltl]
MSLAATRPRAHLQHSGPQLFKVAMPLDLEAEAPFIREPQEGVAATMSGFHLRPVALHLRSMAQRTHASTRK